MPLPDTPSQACSAVAMPLSRTISSRKDDPHIVTIHSEDGSTSCRIRQGHQSPVAAADAAPTAASTTAAFTATAAHGTTGPVSILQTSSGATSRRGPRRHISIRLPKEEEQQQQGLLTSTAAAAATGLAASGPAFHSAILTHNLLMELAKDSSPPGEGEEAGEGGEVERDGTQAMGSGKYRTADSLASLATEDTDRTSGRASLLGHSLTQELASERTSGRSSRPSPNSLAPMPPGGSPPGGPNRPAPRHHGRAHRISITSSSPKQGPAGGLTVSVRAGGACMCTCAQRCYQTSGRLV